MRNPSIVPLCVDLDGTLTRVDTLDEAAIRFVTANPLHLILLVSWLLRGRAYLKQRLSERVHLDATRLPYHHEFLAYLRQEHARGRPLWMVTGASRQIAEAVASHLGIFEGVIATEHDRNMTGQTKESALAERFREGFDYAGNGRADLVVWRSARRRILVGVASGVAHRARALGSVEREFAWPRSGETTVFRALRLHHWAKNVLVFVPLLAAHRVRDLAMITQSALAFLSFGLVASTVYVINDLVDIDSDRRHLRKRHRPIASGALPIRVAVTLPPILLACAGVLSSSLPRAFGAMLTAYFVASLAYSFGIKRRIALDVVVLAALYTSRIFAGGFAANIAISEWLATFSMFVFLSLALVKRLSELVATDVTSGRSYVSVDREPVLAMGTGSGYLSVLVLALYISNADVVRLYPRPAFLWALCPMLLYWMSRLWLLARRGLVHDDPLVFALKDRMTYLVAIAGAVVVLLGSRP